MSDVTMYMIVNESLNMSVGKIAAQVAHAAQGIIAKYYLDDYSDPTMSLYPLWFKNHKKIIVLKASANKFNSLIETYKDCYVVVDAGFTEVPAGSKTVIALQPMEKAKDLKRLRCL